MSWNELISFCIAGMITIFIIIIALILVLTLINGTVIKFQTLADAMLIKRNKLN